MNQLKGIVLVFLISCTATSYGQKLQAIHNSADPALDTIDVYISVFGSPADTVQDVPFRAATPVMELPLPNLPIDVGIAPGNSTSINDTLKNFRVTVPSGVIYIGLIQGVVNPSQFAPNPDGLDISLNAVINQNGRETSNTPGQVEFFFVHGVTDAPTLDINIHSGANLVDNAAYSDFTGYISLTPMSYQIDITDASGSTTLYSLLFDLSGFADSALTVFASGFVDPASNQNGEPFGLFAATPGGNVMEFSPVTNLNEPVANKVDGFVLHQNYPNPFNPSTSIKFKVPPTGSPLPEGARGGFVMLKVYDINGREVATLVNEEKQPGEYRVQWDAEGFASGVYLYKLTAGDFVQSRKMLLMK